MKYLNLPGGYRSLPLGGRFLTEKLPPVVTLKDTLYTQIFTKMLYLQNIRKVGTRAGNCALFGARVPKYLGVQVAALFKLFIHFR